MPNHTSKPSLRRTIVAAAIALAGATGVVAPAVASTGLASGGHRPEALSLNFTKVEFMDYTDDSCMGAASVCLIEDEGLYPPFTR
jgi:hypothetical protein